MSNKTILAFVRRLQPASKFAVLAALCLTAPAEAQQSRVETARRKVSDYTAVFDAMDNKSDFCKGYIGKVAGLSSFSSILSTLPSPMSRGEFETTAAYEQRISAGIRKVPAKPLLISVPIDREYVTYYPDDKIFMVRSAAFGTGYFSSDFEVHVSGTVGLVPANIPAGFSIPLSDSKRTIGSYIAETEQGNNVQVTKIEKVSTSIYISAKKLFRFTKSDESPVLIIEKIAPAQAPALKQSLRLALAVNPRAPYIFKYADEGRIPTAAHPFHYDHKLTAIYADAKCALLLDGQSRVLDAVDAGL